MPETVVIKVGGGILLSAEETKALSAAIATLSTYSRVVVVHGGGPQATKLAGQLGHEPRIVSGRRVTSDLDLELVLSTVCGLVNSQLVAALVGASVQAVGLNGASANMVTAKRRPPWKIDGEDVDFGHVGDIREINPEPATALLDRGYVPVIATVGIDDDGNLLNINADTTAAALACALGANHLLLVTSAGAVLRDGAALPKCDPTDVARGLSEGWINSGMHVKLETGLEALRGGVGHVKVVGPHGLTRPGSGTELVIEESGVSADPGGINKDDPLPLDVVSILKTLVRFPSVTGSEKDIADWVEQWAAEAGLSTGRFEDNVYCWLGEGDSTLLLNSHLDVVPPSSNHPFDPFDPVEKDGCLYGRGSVDAKSSGAAMLATIGNLAAEGWTPTGGRLLVALTACEEGTGKYNGLDALLPHLPQLAGALVGEPTGLEPCVSQKGLLILKARATGRSAHAARAALGENAIEKAARDIARLKNFQFERVDPNLGPTSIAVTTIAGGKARNVIPDECTFFIDIRTTPSYTHDEIINKLQGMLESELSVHSGRYVPASTPEGSIIECAVIDALPSSTPFGSPTVSDWAFLGPTPAIKIGPGNSELSHTGAEHISVDEVRSAVGVYTNIVKSFFDPRTLAKHRSFAIMEA